MSEREPGAEAQDILDALNKHSIAPGTLEGGAEPEDEFSEGIRRIEARLYDYASVVIRMGKELDGLRTTSDAPPSKHRDLFGNIVSLGYRMQGLEEALNILQNRETPTLPLLPEILRTFLPSKDI